MADLRFSVSTGEASITSTAKTLTTTVMPANQRGKVLGVEITGQGIANGDTPVKFELIVATSISVGTAGSVTVGKDDDSYTETIQSTNAGNYSVEPTYTGAVVKKILNVHPQFGMIYRFPLGQELKLKGGQVFAVRATSNQAETMALQTLIEE